MNRTKCARSVVAVALMFVLSGAWIGLDARLQDKSPCKCDVDIVKVAVTVDDFDVTAEATFFLETAKDDTGGDLKADASLQQIKVITKSSKDDRDHLVLMTNVRCGDTVDATFGNLCKGGTTPRNFGCTKAELEKTIEDLLKASGPLTDPELKNPPTSGLTFRIKATWQCFKGERVKILTKSDKAQAPVPVLLGGKDKEPGDGTGTFPGKKKEKD